MRNTIFTLLTLVLVLGAMESQAQNCQQNAAAQAANAVKAQQFASKSLVRLESNLVKLEDLRSKATDPKRQAALDKRIERVKEIIARLEAKLAGTGGGTTPTP
jgi:hypothetical protein